MAKSRKGKKASKNLMVKRIEKLIDERFNQTPYQERTALFVMLEKWANNELNKECCDIFLTALYNAQSTQDIQIAMAFEKAVKRITK